MTWLDTIRGTTREISPRANVESPLYPLTSQALVDMLVGPATVAGVHVNERSALGLPAVYRAIALIADTCGSLPLHVYRDLADDTRSRLRTTPRIIASPHPDLTPFEWRELVFVHLLGWGNAYLWKLRDQSGVVKELWPIEPSRVTVGRTSTGEKMYGVGAVNLSDQPREAVESAAYEGSLLPLTDREILHIPGLGYDGTSGMSPIRAARLALGTAMATEEHGAKFFGSGTMLSGILRTEQRINQDVADLMKARWKQSVGGLDNAHDVAVLGHGTTFEPISISPSDAQFIETQKFGIQQVARLFGVPPHLLMDTEKSTSWGTGIEQQSIGFVMFTLRPWLVRTEARLSTLLPSPQYAKFSVEGLLRGDTTQRYASYAMARQWGWLSVNDIRRLEDLPPVDGGDTYLEPLNMKAIGTEPADLGDGAAVDDPTAAVAAALAQEARHA